MSDVETENQMQCEIIRGDGIHLKYHKKQNYHLCCDIKFECVGRGKTEGREYSGENGGKVKRLTQQ